MVPRVSIVIPAYNEATRLTSTLGNVVTFFRNHDTAELLVVDDGSADGTADIAERYLGAQSNGLAWRVLRLPVNRGKGYAVRHGLLAARAPVALFSDADLSTPITELPKLVSAITSGGCDIVFGSRAVDRRLIETRQPIYRDGAGRLFNLALRLATGLPFLDTQCGFKAFRMSVCRPILESAVVDRFGFDLELLFVASRAGLRLREVPVRWRHHEGSKVRLSRDGPRMLADIVTVRRAMIAGRYNAAMRAATASARLEQQWAVRPVRALVS
jgi:dolichyl-phosphate beta-glucosyltransferase